MYRYGYCKEVRRSECSRGNSGMGVNAKHYKANFDSQLINFICKECMNRLDINHVTLAS